MAATIKKTYKYEPLRSGHFRVIKFLHPLEGLDIRCKLDDHPIPDNVNIFFEYDALSYTWGDHEHTESIEIDGRTLPITWSLYYALYHLRSRHPRIWIDAVCIDQDNKEEKELQVQQMKRIYERAVKVVIWLGDATTATDEVMDALRRLEEEQKASTGAGQEWAFNEPLWKGTWSRLQAEGIDTERGSLILLTFGLKDLMARQWFTRVWIIQEVAFARSAVVCCGAKSISGKVFSLAPSLLDVPIGKLRRAILDIMPGVPRAESWWNGSRDLFSLLQRFSRSQASEARDRIYALMNMCSDASVSREIIPNYRNTDVEVVHEVIYYLFGLKKLHDGSTSYRSPEDLEHRIIESCPTVSSLMESLESIKAETLAIYRADDKALSVNDIYETCAERGEGASVALRFLLQHANVRNERVPPRTLEASASHKLCGRRLLQLLLDWRGNKVTGEIVRAAAANEGQGKEIIQFLLEHRGSEIVITQWIIVIASYNLRHGKDIIQLLLEERGNEIAIGREALRAAVYNYQQGKEIIQLLLDWRGREPVVIEWVVLAAVANHKYGWGKEIIHMLLERRGREVVVTEKILITAASNEWQGREIIQLLLEQQVSEVVVTEAVFRAAARNSRQGKGILQLL